MISDEDRKLLREARFIIGSDDKFSQLLKDLIIKAAENIDWQQVILNGGPPCFRVQDDGRFCLRARRWDGHPLDHEFVSLDNQISYLLSIP